MIRKPTFKPLLRMAIGRERGTWRTLRSPVLRHVFFGDAIDCVIYSLHISLPRVYCIQIGSHDGTANDPLWTFRHYPNLRGILVEPVDYVFRRLARNYTPLLDRFILENVAIAPETGRRPFYYIAESVDLSVGYDRLGSLHQEVLRKHLPHFPGATERIVTDSVQCLTFQDLCDRHRVDAVDLLHIDAEGSDAEILVQVDFQRHQPSIVLYEHIHLSESDQSETRMRLQEHGYEVAHIGRDTLSVRRTSLASMPALRTAWSRVVRQP